MRLPILTAAQMIAFVLLFTTMMTAQNKSYSAKEAQDKVSSYIYTRPDSARYYLRYLIRHNLGQADSTVAKHLNNLGMLHSLNQNADSAAYYYERSIEKGNAKNRLGTMINLAVIKKKARDYDQAVALLSTVIDSYKARHDERGLATAYGEMGSVYSMKNDRVTAIDYFKQGIALGKKHQLSRIMAIQQLNLANIYYDSRNYEFARELYEDCLPKLKASTDKVNYAVGLANYGSTLLQLGDTEKSAVVLHEAAGLLEPFNNDSVKAVLHGHLAAIAVAKKNTVKAEREYQIAYKHILNSKSPESLSVVSGYIAFLNQEGQYNKALGIINTMERTIDFRKSNEKEKLDFYKEASNTLLHTGEDSRAVQALKDVIALKDTVSEIENDQQLKEIEAKYQSAAQLAQTRHLKAENKNLAENADSLLFSYRYALLAAIALAALLTLVYLYFRRSQQSTAAEVAGLGEQHKNSERALHDERSRAEQNEELIRMQQQQLLAESLRNINHTEQLQAIVNEFRERNELGSASKIEELTEKSHWKHFIEKFTAVNPYFIQKLSEKYPQLNQSELQFCALVKVNLSYKEIGNILQITHQSVFTKKYRVKKKMALDDDADFIDTIRAL